VLQDGWLPAVSETKIAVEFPALSAAQAPR